MNVTPLVDVCLVLLIISMVVVPLLAKVKPPKTDDPFKLSKDSKKVHLELRQDGTTWLGNEGAEPNWVVESELEASLRETFERDPGAQVVLAADAELTTGDVRPVLATVRRAGFATLFLISQKEGAQPGTGGATRTGAEPGTGGATRTGAQPGTGGATRTGAAATIKR